MTKKRARQPDPRTNADRPGCTLLLRLGDELTAKLDAMTGAGSTRNATVRAALEEKYKRFSRRKRAF